MSAGDSSPTGARLHHLQAGAGQCLSQCRRHRSLRPCTEGHGPSSPCGEISASLVGLGKLELCQEQHSSNFAFHFLSEEAWSPRQRLGIQGLLDFSWSAYGLVLKFPDESSLSGPLFNSWTRGSSSKGVGGGAAGGSRGDRFPWGSHFHPCL